MAATPPDLTPYSNSFQELYHRRDFVRDLLDAQGESGNADIADTTNREVASVSPEQGGIYSSAGVSGQLRKRAQEAGGRSGGYLENMLSKSKAMSEMSQSGDLAANYSHQEDRDQGYAQARARGQAQESDEGQAALMGLGGTLASAALFALIA